MYNFLCQNILFTNIKICPSEQKCRNTPKLYTTEDSSIKIFCSNYNLTSMINKPTCYENPDKPTCIDQIELILTNCPGSFQNSCVIEAVLSDFYKMIVTVMKTFYWKIEPWVINFRVYKSFSNERFIELLRENRKGKLSENSDKNLRNFINTCNSVLDKQFPEKKSILEVINRLL